jgi:hypothetical protein
VIPRFSLSTLFKCITALGLALGIICWFVPPPPPVLGVQCDDPQATIYLDDIPLGKQPILLTRWQLKRLLNKRGYELGTAPIQFEMFSPVGGLVVPATNREGRSPLIWVKGAEPLRYPLENPFGIGSRVRAGGVHPLTDRHGRAVAVGDKQHADVTVLDIYLNRDNAQSEYIDGQVTIKRDQGKPGVQIEFNETPPELEQIELKVHVWVETNAITFRRDDPRSVGHRAESRPWIFARDGGKMFLTLPDLAEGCYWIHGACWKTEGEIRDRFAFRLPPTYVIIDQKGAVTKQSPTGRHAGALRTAGAP